jgi:hypothetical protein
MDPLIWNKLPIDLVKIITHFNNVLLISELLKIAQKIAFRLNTDLLVYSMVNNSKDYSIAMLPEILRRDDKLCFVCLWNNKYSKVNYPSIPSLHIYFGVNPMKREWNFDWHGGTWKDKHYELSSAIGILKRISHAPYTNPYYYFHIVRNIEWPDVPPDILRRILAFTFHTHTSFIQYLRNQSL